MKRQLFEPDFAHVYMQVLSSLDWLIWKKYGSRKKFAAVLGVDLSYLCKVFTGVTACNSRLFLKMLCMLDLNPFWMFAPVNAQLVSSYDDNDKLPF